MLNKTYRLEFFTPCFMAGAANPAKAEIRSPSVRGQLRWWFRVIGGTREEEKNVFGGVGEVAQAGALITRISNSRIMSDPAILPSMRIDNPLSYLLYYADASGKAKGAPHGPRFQKDGFIGPNSTFDLILIQRRALPLAIQQKLELAIEAFLQLGSLGLRGTRGCGAFFCQETSMKWDAFLEWTGKLKTVSMLYVADYDDEEEWLLDSSKWQRALVYLEEALKALRKKYSAGKSGDTLTPLGCSGNRPAKLARQASALHLRPLMLKDDDNNYVIMPAMFYAPATLDSKIEDKPRFAEDIKGFSFNFEDKRCYLQYYED